MTDTEPIVIRKTPEGYEFADPAPGRSLVTPELLGSADDSLVQTLVTIVGVEYRVTGWDRDRQCLIIEQTRF